MPPKAAEKKPQSAGKAPAGKAPAEKKEAGKKTAAATGEKKKNRKTRKETYSSYIYKGMSRLGLEIKTSPPLTRIYSLEASPPRYWYLQPCHVNLELIRQW
jgi:hypothetical protein